MLINMSIGFVLNEFTSIRLKHRKTKSKYFIIVVVNNNNKYNANKIS